MKKNLLVQEKTLKPLQFQYKKNLLENMSCILKFIDNGRFMTSSLSSLVNNLSKGIHRIKCQYRMIIKKCETYGIKYKHLIEK